MNGPAVGWIGLGDQGLPMAAAIAENGFPLRVWARRPSSLDGLNGVAHIPQDTVQELAASCDVVGLCVSTDEDVLNLVCGGLLDGLRPGSVVVNHGTGTPGNAERLAQLCAPAGVEVLDAPVSGGRPAALERRLTTMVGGPESAARRCDAVFASFSRHVLHLGDTGSGQRAKLLNNALMILNQASIADVFETAEELGVDLGGLFELLKVSSGSSTSLTLLNTMVTPDTVDHLSAVEAVDMELFDTAMREAGVNAAFVTERGLDGVKRLPQLVRRLNRDASTSSGTGRSPAG